MIIIVAKQLGKLNPIDYSAEVSHALKDVRRLIILLGIFLQTTRKYYLMYDLYSGKKFSPASLFVERELEYV